MRYFFFDIDGTLLLSGGAGRVAMTKVMSEMFGLDKLCQIEVHGRTDRGIIDDLFRAHDIQLDDRTRRRFGERYHQLLPQALQNCAGTLMPGVRKLLDRLSRMPDVQLGILTGNSRSAADSKLRHFQLDSFFSFGGFGDFHPDRNDVARMAMDDCRKQFPTAQHDDAWVVGDTVNDVTCGRAIGAKVVAVGTGGADMQTLHSSGPDVLLADLSDADLFLTSTGLI